MAKAFLSTLNTILPSSSSSTITTATLINPNTNNLNRPNSLPVPQTKATSESPPLFLNLTKRALTLNLTSLLTLSLAGYGSFSARASTLEDGNDMDPTDKAYLQELVYKLGKVGQAIQDNKLSVASSFLGPSTNVDWVKNVNKAFTKLSSSAEEKTEVDTFNSSLTSLITSVSQRDIISSKIAFVSSVVSLEKWTTLTGLVGQLKGL